MSCGHSAKKWQSRDLNWVWLQVWAPKFHPGWRNIMATLDNAMTQRLASNKEQNTDSLSSELLCLHAARRITKKRLQNIPLKVH